MQLSTIVFLLPRMKTRAPSYDKSDHRVRFYGKPLFWVNKSTHPNAPVLTGRLIMPLDMLEFAMEHQKCPRMFYNTFGENNKLRSLSLQIALWEVDREEVAKTGAAYSGTIKYYSPHILDNRLRSIIVSHDHHLPGVWNFLKGL